MPARRSHLDHQPIHLSIGLFEHGRGQRVGGNDGQKPGPRQGAEVALHEVPRVESRDRIVTLPRAGHL